MASQSNQWNRLRNGGLKFANLGLVMAQLGNLYRAASDEDVQATKPMHGIPVSGNSTPLHLMGLARRKPV